MLAHLVKFEDGNLDLTFLEEPPFENQLVHHPGYDRDLSVTDIYPTRLDS